MERHRNMVLVLSILIFNLFLTQHEWASGGLSVNNEIVYVPCDLVGGLAMSNCGIRNVISKVLLDI